jgi:hypothetical protein
MQPSISISQNIDCGWVGDGIGWRIGRNPVHIRGIYKLQF